MCNNHQVRNPFIYTGKTCGHCLFWSGAGLDSEKIIEFFHEFYFQFFDLLPKKVDFDGFSINKRFHEFLVDFSTFDCFFINKETSSNICRPFYFDRFFHTQREFMIFV